MWSFYMLMFKDHSECTNAAPSMIDTYSLAVDQLGTSLSKRGMPTDPGHVTREHLVEWFLYLQRPAEDGGRGVAATANRRHRSVAPLFKFLLDQNDIADNPMTKMSPPGCRRSWCP